MMAIATHATIESRDLPLPPRDARLAEMLARWHAARRSDPLPLRADVTFEAMLPMVGHVDLVDVLPAGSASRFVFRLVCTARETRDGLVVRATGDIRPAALARATEADFAACVTAAAPVLREVTLGDGARTVRFFRLILPYAERRGDATPSFLADCLVDEPGVRELLADPSFRNGAG